jgi:hypothetical protein
MYLSMLAAENSIPYLKLAFRCKKMFRPILINYKFFAPAGLAVFLPAIPLPLFRDPVSNKALPNP